MRGKSLLITLTLHDDRLCSKMDFVLVQIASWQCMFLHDDKQNGTSNCMILDFSRFTISLITWYSF